ncbi:hypothetical protein K2E96_28400 [Pseudomonas sp. ERGC3:05]|nr:hypothetical protein K2E96_28400 [Pseudomonas sp. ERGC3:05]
MPVRKNIALENLKAAYGADHPFDVRNISIANIDASESQHHSLLDIYMSGKMDRIPRGERYDFQLGNRFPGSSRFLMLTRHSTASSIATSTT